MTNQVNTGSAPEAKPHGPNDAALAAKLDAANTPQPSDAPAKAERPADIPEKFWDADKGEVKLAELAKSYGELEKRQSQPKDAKDGQEPQKGAENQPVVEEVKDALKDAGLDFDNFNEEFLRDGILSEASYEKLAKAGYEKGIVDVYVAGLKSQADALVGAAHKAAGGEEQFKAMAEWAVQNVPDAELEAFNAVMATADPAKIALAVQGMAARHATAEGREPDRRIDGEGTTSSDVYESTAQMKADMRDPKYKSDPAFRAKVQEKLGRSKIM